MSTRRNFIKNATALTAGTALIPLVSKAESLNSKVRKIKVPKNGVILFQGDSITDASRTREVSQANDNQALGNGYASMVAAQLLYDNPSKNLKIFNRGISGNKVYQLAERWDTDCLQLKPDVLSIMVGVNDFWHTLTHGYKGTVEIYKTDYIKLLQKTKSALPDLQLIIAGPYAVKGVKSVDDQWYPVFEEYQHAALEIANQFDAVYIPLQKVFDQAQEAMPGKFWTGDGVHPSIEGARIMSSAWLSCFNS